MTTRNDAAFYVDSPGSQVVWESKDCDFYVIRAGEMRIVYKPNSNEQEVLRYTDDLEDKGIMTDADLPEDNDDFYWAHNAWFEVCHKEEGDWFSDPMFDIDEAIAHAKTATLDD
jgi:hypothetical protein